MTRRQFYKSESSQPVRTCILAGATICHLYAAYTLAASGLGALPDVLFLFTMALGVQLWQNRVCAVVLMVYAVLSNTIGMMFQGSIFIWLLLIAGFLVIRGTFLLNKEYLQYSGK